MSQYKPGDEDEQILFTGDPELSECAIGLLSFILRRNRSGLQPNCQDLYEAPIPTSKQDYDGTIYYGKAAKKTALLQLESLKYIEHSLAHPSRRYIALRCGRHPLEISEKYSRYYLLPDKSKYSGFVYVVRRTGDGIFKIGTSTNLRSRITSVSLACGSHLEIYGYLDCEKPYQTEENCHRLCYKSHLLGEWFALSSADLRVLFAYFSEHVDLNPKSSLTQLVKSFQEVRA